MINHAFVGCPVCNQIDMEMLFRSFASSSNPDLQEVGRYENINLCKQCGVIFRSPLVNINRPPLYGSRRTAKIADLFQQRFELVSEQIGKRLDAQGVATGYHLEVGAGPGYLLAALKARLPALEPDPKLS